VAFMLEVADWVAALPGAVRMVHSFGGGALLLMTLGLVWLTLWQSAIRWLGIVFAVAGLALALRAPQPDLVTDPRGQALAYRTPLRRAATRSRWRSGLLATLIRARPSAGARRLMAGATVWAAWVACTTGVASRWCSTGARWRRIAPAPPLSSRG